MHFGGQCRGAGPSPPDQLREIMASRGVFTTHLAPLLAERAITLSASQIHRLVTGTPERLSLPVLAALCDLLEVTPAELIVTSADNATTRKIAAATGPAPVVGPTGPGQPAMRTARTEISRSVFIFAPLAARGAAQATGW